jgi:hypothetical protein
MTLFYINHTKICVRESLTNFGWFSFGKIDVAKKTVGLKSFLRWCHLAESSSNFLESSSHLAESISHVAGSSSRLAESSIHIAESSSHLAESSSHVAESSSHVTKSSSHLAKTSRIKQVYYGFLEGSCRFFFRFFRVFWKFSIRFL